LEIFKFGRIWARSPYGNSDWGSAIRRSRLGKGARPFNPAFVQIGVPQHEESAMYQLSRTVPVNEPKKSFLSRHDVWTGLLMKAGFVAQHDRRLVDA
jgi:hypothetical protein